LKILKLLSDTSLTPLRLLLELAQHNMHSDFMTDNDKWPYRTDKHDPAENLLRAWCHSDIREVAFAHTWKAFEKIVAIGDLSQQ
jgi:hypothetical protein